MSAPSNVTQAANALQEARTKGSHTVRVSADLLEMLLNGYGLLSLAFAEIDERESNA